MSKTLAAAEAWIGGFGFACLVLSFVWSLVCVSVLCCDKLLQEFEYRELLCFGVWCFFCQVAIFKMMSFLLCLSDPIPNLFSKDQALVDVLSMLFWCFFLSLQLSKCLFCSHLILDWGAFQDTNLVLKRSGSWCILHVVLVFLPPLQSSRCFLCCFLFLTEELFKTPTLFSREQFLDVFSVLFWFFFVSLQSSNCCFVGIFFLPEELSKTPTLFSKVKALTWCDLHVVFLSYYLVLFSLFWFLLSVHLSPCFFFLSSPLFYGSVELPRIMCWVFFP